MAACALFEQRAASVLPDAACHRREGVEDGRLFPW